jgi:hypothetical protein
MMKRTLFSLVLAAAFFSVSRAEAAARIVCKGNWTVTVDVQGHYGQVKVYDGNRLIDQWRGHNHTTFEERFPPTTLYYFHTLDDEEEPSKTLRVRVPSEGRGPKRGEGWYMYNRHTSPLRLSCTAQ